MEMGLAVCCQLCVSVCRPLHHISLRSTPVSVYLGWVPTTVHRYLSGDRRSMVERREAHTSCLVLTALPLAPPKVLGVDDLTVMVLLLFMAPAAFGCC